MLKKVFNLGILLIALALFLNACGGAPANTQTPAEATEEAPAEVAEAPTEAAEAPAEAAEPGQVEIRWFVGLGTGTDPGQVEVENKVIEAFNASHPNIKLVLEVVAYEAARDTLATEISSGNPPDIVGPVGVSGAEAFHGQWLDLTPLIDKTNYDLSQYDDSAVDFYKVGGEGQIGIPFAIFPSALFYQRDLFDEAGLEYPPHKYGEKYKWADGPEEEWNYETLRKLALKLTVDKNGKDATDPEFDPQNIVQYGYHPQWQDLRAIGSYFGADSLVASDGQTAQVPPAWADAWKWLYDGMWKDHFIAAGPVASSEEFGQDNVFNSGRAAMALTHLWYTCCLTDAGNNWDVAAVPSYNGKTTANFNADTFRILKGTKHPNEAFEVLTYLLGEASLELLNAYGGMPARSADQQTFFDQQDKQFPQDVDWQVFIDGIAYADNPSFEGYMPNYNEAFDYTNTFLSNLTATEGLDMDTEIEKFQKDLQVIFDKKQ
jgi:multiple sugar transport system substrate-binding protein